MTDVIKYSEAWTDTHEIDFIEHIGCDRVLNAHGKYEGKHQRLINEEIIEILSGYIRGAHLKDWDRTCLTECKCVCAAKERIQSLKNK